MIKRATQLWNRLLERNEQAATETRHRMLEGIAARGLMYGDRAISTFLRPRFIDEATWRQAAHVGGHFHTSLSRLLPVFRSDRKLLDDLGIHGRLQDLVCSSPVEADTLWFNRVDGFLDDGVIRLVEFNVDSPGGAAFVDGMAEVFRRLPIFNEFQSHMRLWRRPSIPYMRRCAQRAALQRGTRKVRLAIIDWQEVATAREFVLIAEDFSRHGIETVIVDPRAVDIAKGRLVAEGKPVDLVFKRVLVTDLAERHQEVKPFLEALRRNLVGSLNPLSAQAVTTKSLLALFHEGRLDAHLGQMARDVWHRHIPWTVRIREGRARRGERSVDVMSYLARHKERLVLKPADAYGAAGIVLGWHASQAEWDQHLTRMLDAGDYVAQEKVRIPTEEYPDADDGRLRYRTVHTEISPYTFFPRSTSECLARLSSSDFLNVKAGGGVVTTYVVSE